MAADFLRLSGKRVLVTGASSGIGRATAIEASRHGARLALVGRHAETLADTLALLDGDDHLIVTIDLDDSEAISAMVTSVAAQFGGLDSIVHAAGGHAAVPLKSVTSSSVTSLFGTNVTSAIMLAKAFRARPVVKVAPSIVFVSSAVGLVGQSGVSVYSATKGAIVSLTKSLSLELARDGIRVNCVCPGIVATALTDRLRARIGDSAWQSVEAAHPLGIGDPVDVANSILYLVSDASKWITGSALVVDGGYTAQ